MPESIKPGLRIVAMLLIALVASRIENHADPERLNSSYLFVLWYIVGLLLLIYAELTMRKR